MSEQYPVTTHRAIQGYLRGLDKGELDWTEHFSEDLGSPAQSNRSFRSGEFAGMVVVPALITEEDGLGQTLDVITESGADVGVVISANLPNEGTELSVCMRNIEAIQERVHGNPNFPMGFFLASYPVRTTIGRIVRDAYGVTLHRAAAIHGPGMHNMPLFRADADTRQTTPGYFPNAMAMAAQLDRPNYLIHPILQHDRLDPASFPNLNRALDWYDLYMTVTAMPVSAHFAVDMLGYAAAHGSPAESLLSENLALEAAMQKTKGMPPLKRVTLHNEAVWMSCRRLAKRSVVEGLFEYDMLLTSDDRRPTHRNEPPKRDITPREYRKQIGSLVLNTLHRLGDQIFRAEVRNGTSKEDATELSLVGMAEFGETFFERFGDPQEMRSVLAGALRMWPKSGPATDTARKFAFPKITSRNAFPKASAGGEGVLLIDSR